MSTKVTGLTALNVKAIEAHADFLKVSISKTTATFEGDAGEAAARVRQAQEKEAEKGGRKGGHYASLHAVARKLENQQPNSARLQLVADSTDPASLANIPGLNREIPKVLAGKVVADSSAVQNAAEAADAILQNSGYTKTDQESETETGPVWGTAEVHGLVDGENFDFYGKDKAKPKAEPHLRKYNAERMGGKDVWFWAAKSGTKTAKAAPAKKETAKESPASRRTVPDQAVNRKRQEWIDENGIENYRKQYNSGWDNATYNTGEKKAKSGEASPAWMDGYTDRKANPGKPGIAAKWSALKSTKAPIAKV